MWRLLDLSDIWRASIRGPSSFTCNRDAHWILVNKMLLIAGFFFIYILLKLIEMLKKVWLNPIRINDQMKSQGIKGPSYQFLYGNTKEIIEMRSASMAKSMDDISHNIFPRILPHVHSWTDIYGKTCSCISLSLLYLYPSSLEVLIYLFFFYCRRCKLS